jgi:hypothetical protein
MATHPVTLMTAAAAICWGVLTIVTRGNSPSAVTLGLLGPLVAAVASWILVERTHAKAPTRVSAVMITLFAVKIVLFGAYIVVVATSFPEARVAFIVSFTCHYILLHVLEALYLRRLFSAAAARSLVS